jgi:flagellar biosynthetic protein FliS
MDVFEQGYDAYQQTATNAKAATADPYQLVLMLVDGLLDELARIEGHIEAKQFERKGKSMAKALQILGGLDSALDMENGGELADNLRRLYDYCGQQLFDVSVHNDIAKLKSVIKVLSELKEGWQAMAKTHAA